MHSLSSRSWNLLASRQTRLRGEVECDAFDVQLLKWTCFVMLSGFKYHGKSGLVDYMALHDFNQISSECIADCEPRCRRLLPIEPLKRISLSSLLNLPAWQIIFLRTRLQYMFAGQANREEEEEEEAGGRG